MSNKLTAIVNKTSRQEPPKRPSIFEAVASMATSLDAVVRRLVALEKQPAPVDGVGISEAVVDRDGVLVLVRTDGSKLVVGQVVGADPDNEAIAAIVTADIEARVAEMRASLESAIARADRIEQMVADAVDAAIAALPNSQDGVGIADVLVNAEGRLAVVLTDHRRIDAGPVVPEAKPGPAGRSILSGHVTDDGDLVLDMSDGETVNVGHVVGKPGVSVRGDPGRGVASTAIEDGKLVVNYSDDTSEIVGEVVGKPGRPGRKGDSVKGDKGDSVAVIDVRRAAITAADLDRLSDVEIQMPDGTTMRVLALI